MNRLPFIIRIHRDRSPVGFTLRWGFAILGVHPLPDARALRGVARLSSFNRWLPILFILGLVAVAFIAFGQRPMPRETVRDIDDQDLRLLSFAEDAVAEFVIDYDDAPRVVLRPEQTETDGNPMMWSLTEPFLATADGDLVMNAISGLASLHAFRYIDPDDADIDIAAFGLNPPLATVSIRLIPEEIDTPPAAYVILVGEATPVVVGEYETYYVQLPGSDDVYVAGGPAFSLINVPAESLSLVLPGDADSPADGGDEDQGFADDPLFNDDL